MEVGKEDQLAEDPHIPPRNNCGANFVVKLGRHTLFPSTNNTTCRLIIVWSALLHHAMRPMCFNSLDDVEDIEYTLTS